MKHLLWIFLGFMALSCQDVQLVFETDALRVSLDARGNVASLANIATGTDYYPEKEKSPLLTLYENDTVIILPQSILFDQSQSILTLEYPNGSTAIVKFDNKSGSSP